jgi:hypothetical protein
MARNLLRQEHVRQSSLKQKSLLCRLDEHYLLTGLSGATYGAITLRATPSRANGSGNSL